MRIQELTSVVDGDKTIYFLANGEAGTIGILRLDPDGFILSVLVEEARRGNKVGSLLVYAACHWCQKAGRESVGLSVSDSNPRARELYRRLGFIQYIPGHDGYTQFIKPLA